MSSAGITFSGLASGLDTKSIISALVAIEQRPITQLETKKSTLSKSKSLMGNLGDLLEALQTKAKSLKTTTDFLKMKVASDNEDVLTATASSSATPGTHKVHVNHLATAQLNAHSGSASNTTNLGAGEFTLNVGGQSLPIALSNTTLDGIASAISSAAEAQDLGVRAEVIDTGGSGSSRYQLVVRATDTGTAGAFTITDIDGDSGFSSVMTSLAGNRLTTAQDASLTVDGIPVTRSSNSVTGAIAGVTLDLKSASPTTPANQDVTITIATDAEETAKKVQEFVDAYNKVVDFVQTQNALGEDGKAKNPLFGDSTLRTIRSSLRSVVGGTVTTSGNTAYQMFAQIGITSDRDGKLTFTQSKLEEALSTDEQAVAAVFTDPTNGIAKKLATQIDLYTDSVDGLLKARSDGYDRMVKQTQDRIDQAETRLEQYQKQLETKYANLESLLSKLQSQGSSVNNIK